MSTTELRPARLRVPGSTSNLGSGFDTVGLALDRYLEATFTPDGSGALTVEREGTLVRLDDFPGPDLVAETFRNALAGEGATASGHLHLRSSIPVIRGFGSSAAALVAGHDLARAALGKDADRRASFRVAYAREGHGDNAGPSAFGGLQAVVRGEDGPRALTLQLADSIGFAYAAPAAALATSKARAALPGTVPHGTAVASLGRLVALLEGLAQGDPELIRIGIEDELHVPYRLPLIADAKRAVAAAYDAGAWGVTISGGGSGLIALCPLDVAHRVGQAMREVFAGVEDAAECVGFAVRPDFEGLKRL
jgi:homoserine kinase